MTTIAPKTHLSSHPKQGFLHSAAMIASLSGLLFGYDTGVVSGAQLFLKTQYHLSPTMQEVMTGVVLVTAIIACLGGTP